MFCTSIAIMLCGPTHFELFDKCFIGFSKSPEMGHLSTNGVEKETESQNKNPDQLIWQSFTKLCKYNLGSFY